jgi:hypothetical protein
MHACYNQTLHERVEFSDVVAQALSAGERSCGACVCTLDVWLCIRAPDTAARHRRLARVYRAGADKDAIAAFNEVRQIPQIVDGIRCSCGCARAEGNYSLLSCFERPRAMARWCDRCQREARYVYSLQRNGKTLDEIREAIDSRYH